MMNENAKKWVEALRSGEYKQAFQTLREHDGDVCRFCCLGVANDLSGLGDWQEESYVWSGGCKSEAEVLAPPVRDWLGMWNVDGTINIGGEETTLYSLNDDGKSFSEIADIIERHADQLFR